MVRFRLNVRVRVRVRVIYLLTIPVMRNKSSLTLEGFQAPPTHLTVKSRVKVRRVRFRVRFRIRFRVRYFSITRLRSIRTRGG